ncbi:tigger transposable element-derived protein 4-like, partial [Aphis craccivora]
MDLIDQKDKLEVINVDVEMVKKPSRHDYVKGANFFIFTSVDKVIKSHLTKTNSIIIFDDVICGPQSIIREYFSIYRHSGASSVFYLAQTYSKIPKQLKQDDTNLRHIFNDHSSADMDFSEFRKMCHFCWNHSDYGFLVIDKNQEMNEEDIDAYCYTVHSAISSHPIHIKKKKKNIIRKILELKRGVIDSDNYYRDVFKPIFEPFSTWTEKNTL